MSYFSVKNVKMRYSKILYEVLEELVKTCGIIKCFCFIKNILFCYYFWKWEILLSKREQVSNTSTTVFNKRPYPIYIPLCLACLSFATPVGFTVNLVFRTGAHVTCSQ